MSEHILHQFRDEQNAMNKQARYMVIFLGGLIHVFMNVYIQFFGSTFLKIEVPVISVLTIGIMIVSGRYFDRHAQKAC